MLLWVFALEVVVELRQCLKSFAWPHVVVIAISLLGMRLIVVHLRRQAKAH